MKPSDGGDGGSGQTVTSFGWWCCVYATGSHEGQAYNYKSQSQSGGSSLISWEWFKYRCRKNPDLFLSFFSNRWLCCVVARTVNLKHLRVNDRNVTEEKIERACISDSTLKSFDHLVSVSDCGALKKQKKREKTKRFGPGLILFLFFSTFKIISTNPALLSPVSPRERTKTVIRGQKQMQHQAVSQSEAEDFTHSWMMSQSFWN